MMLGRAMQTAVGITAGLVALLAIAGSVTAAAFVLTVCQWN